jgi:hypothetical protein
MSYYDYGVQICISLKHWTVSANKKKKKKNENVWPK